MRKNSTTPPTPTPPSIKMDNSSLSTGHRTTQAHVFSHTSRRRGAPDPRGLNVVVEAVVGGRGDLKTLAKK